jgi:hypothetical protein
MLQAQNERRELLREAGRAWRKWGGEAALHYTQRAREVAERARGEALDDARGLIEKRRWVSVTVSFFFLPPTWYARKYYRHRFFFD